MGYTKIAGWLSPKIIWKQKYRKWVPLGGGGGRRRRRNPPLLTNRAVTITHSWHWSLISILSHSHTDIMILLSCTCTGQLFEVEFAKSMASNTANCAWTVNVLINCANSNKMKKLIKRNYLCAPRSSLLHPRYNVCIPFSYLLIVLQPSCNKMINKGGA